jgi:NAD(P)-dependent dehydrogenase (short-subunit alcohol dehydrogenase family)
VKVGSPRFAGASAVVTGAGQGIGAAIAIGLAAEGARLVISGRREAKLDGDITHPDHVEELMVKAAGSRGAIDILINNAGIAGPTAPLQEVTLEEWNETLAVNLTGVFLACKLALPYLERSVAGKIVNIGSVTGKQPLPNRAPYAAAKLGVVGLTRTLACELGPKGISVNVISPWLVEGDRLHSVLESMSKERGVSPEELHAEMTEGTAFKRNVTEQEVVGTVLFLCSPAATGLTGQDLNVAAGAVMY